MKATRFRPVAIAHAAPGTGAAKRLRIRLTGGQCEGGKRTFSVNLNVLVSGQRYLDLTRQPKRADLD